MKRKIELILYETHEKVTFYTYQYVDEDSSEFDKFFDQNDTDEFKDDIDLILSWIDKIGKEGAHDRYFRPEIGKLMALPLDTSKLRLYTFKISEGIVILGNGAEKNTRTFNENPILNAHVKNLLSIGSILSTQIKNGKISVYNNELFEVKPISFKVI